MATIASPLAISSTSDMMAAVPSDLFASITDTPDLSVDDGADDTPADAPEDNTIEVPDLPDDPADEPAAEPADEAPSETTEAKPADTTPTEDELPEGVRKGKDRKGKDGYFLEENRYQTFHGNHKLVQQGADLIGEPLTADAIKLRNAAYLGQERLFQNLTSGDPAAQSDVVKFIIDEMKGARENGEVGLDPSIPFAESIYNTLHTEAPEAYARLRHVAARDLLTEMYEQGASGDRNLILSAQRFSLKLAGVPQKPEGMSDDQYLAMAREATAGAGYPFHTLDEAQGLAKVQDPAADLARENAELKAQLDGKTQTGTAAQYDTWLRDNVRSVNTAILDDAVKPALASVDQGWKKFPDDYKRLVVDPLHREVMTIVKADTVLDSQVRDLQTRARRAVSEQVREQLGQQIKQLFVHRANRAAEQVKKPILSFAVEWLKGRSDQNHERRNNAQQRTTPKGQGAPVKSSLAPADLGFKDGMFDTATAMKQMHALLR